MRAVRGEQLKAAYGFLQSKQKYSTQPELLAVAKGYRERHLPIDFLVVDWFYYTKMGQTDMDPRKWPDPAAMNRQLHDQGSDHDQHLAAVRGGITVFTACC